MKTTLKTLDMSRLKPLAGFAPVDETKLANVKLRLNGGKTVTVTDIRRSFEIIGRARGAVAQLSRLPAPGEALHCVLDGSYPLWDFVPAAIELAGQRRIDELYIATLGFSKKNVDALATLTAEGLIDRVTILCSHYFSAADRDIYEHMGSLATSDRFRLVAMRTHAKILLMKIGNTPLVVESSANLRSSHNVETATVINHPELFAFHRKWIEDLCHQAKKDVL